MDRWSALGLLVVGVVGAIGHPRRLPAWSVPVVAALLDLVIGVTGLGPASRAITPLVRPVAFLLAAVPLAVMLDRLGFFTVIANQVGARRGGPGYLWALAALVTTVFNLDAGVVLLTPLYVRLARQRGWDALTLAAQPVLLACLASSALPVSNLTNLVAASWAGASTGQFAAHLAVPSLVASVVGWYCYRGALKAGLPRLQVGPETPGTGARSSGTEAGEGAGGEDMGAGAGYRAGRPGPGAASARVTGYPSGPAGRSDPGALTSAAKGGEATSARPGPVGEGGPPPSPEEVRRGAGVGGAVVLAVLLGFTCGSLVGVPPWAVALGADGALVLALVSIGKRDGRSWRSQIPWGAVPVGTAIMVLALGVLATGAAGYLPVGPLLRGATLPDLVRDTALAGLGANLVNNLPALLVALAKLGHHVAPSLWAVLLGVNMGPVLLVTGSLASLLWLSTLRRLGVQVGAGDFTRFGLRAGLPAAASALAAEVLLRAAGLQ